MGKIQCQVLLAAALLASAAVPAGAQQPPAVTRPGEEVIVTHSGGGEELRGRLIELSPATLALVANGQRVDLPVDNVLRIDVRNDSLKNGAIIGGVVMGSLAGLACAFMDDAPACITGLVFNTGIGVLAGAGIDALHKGRTPIYVRAGKSGAAMQVKVRF
jgi:hypothetical protein